MQTVITLNPLMITVSALVMFFIGMLWFSPRLFGRTYARLSGADCTMTPREKRRGIIVSFITALVASALLSIIAQQGQYAIPSTISAVVLIWLFIMLTQLNAFVWRRERMALFLLVTVRSLLMLLGGALVYCLAH